jgi:hypothetical protein
MATAGMAVVAAAAAGVAICFVCHGDTAGPPGPAAPEPELVAAAAGAETAPAAVRLQQARGRPSPWHWNTNSAACDEPADTSRAKTITKVLSSYRAAVLHQDTAGQLSAARSAVSEQLQQLAANGLGPATTKALQHPLGETLLSAASCGDAELVEWLLDCGADIHHSLPAPATATLTSESGLNDSGSTITSSSAAVSETTTACLTRAIEPAEPAGGWSPFHVACRQGHADCVRCLVRCGCDTALPDAAGRTGRDLCVAAGHAAVLELLDGALAALKAQRQAEKKARRKKQKKMRAVLSRALMSLKGDAAGGLILELGVASGQSINFIADNLPADVAAKARNNGLVHGFDSFEGLPERWR